MRTDRLIHSLAVIAATVVGGPVMFSITSHHHDGVQCGYTGYVFGAIIFGVLAAFVPSIIRFYLECYWLRKSKRIYLRK